MKKLILIVAVLLSGCGLLAPKPEIKYVPVPKEVKVPVPVKCKAPHIDPPEYSFDKAKKGDLMFNNLALLAAENDSLNAYSDRLKAALDGCTK